MKQDKRRLYFVKLHPRPAPLSEPRSANIVADIIGVLSLVALLVVMLLLWGW